MATREACGRVPDVIDEKPSRRATGIGAKRQDAPVRGQRRVYRDQGPVVFLWGIPRAVHIVGKGNVD